MKNILLFVFLAEAHSLEQKLQNMSYKFSTTKIPGDPLTSFCPSLTGANDCSVPGSPQWYEQWTCPAGPPWPLPSSYWKGQLVWHIPGTAGQLFPVASLSSGHAPKNKENQERWLEKNNHIGMWAIWATPSFQTSLVFPGWHYSKSLSAVKRLHTGWIFFLWEKNLRSFEIQGGLFFQAEWDYKTKKSRNKSIAQANEWHHNWAGRGKAG